jgi:hypothetical protein
MPHQDDQTQEIYFDLVRLAANTQEPVLLSLELTCGSSRVHADEWDDSEARHLKHLEIEAWAEQEGIACDLSGTTDGGEQFSDAYLRFPPEQLKIVADALKRIGWTGDILDVYRGKLSKDQAAKIKAFAAEQGWTTERGF